MPRTPSRTPFLRAWRSRETYDGRSTFRAWLYRITTNACLRILERRPRRLMPYEAGPAAEIGARPVPPADLPWLQPYPDLLIDESRAGRGRRHARDDRARLPGRDPASSSAPACGLILRDALDWPADDTAAVLEMSLAAVNSALQRARATMKERLPAARLEWATPPTPRTPSGRSSRRTWRRSSDTTTGSSSRSFARTCGWPCRPTRPGTRDASRRRVPRRRRVRTRVGFAPARADAREQAPGVRRLPG